MVQGQMVQQKVAQGSAIPTTQQGMIPIATPIAVGQATGYQQ
jgi:hypothetical protein